MDKQTRAYIGFTVQFFALLLASLYIGLFIDKQIKWSPTFVWLLPCLVIIGVLISIIQQTYKKNKP